MVNEELKKETLEVENAKSGDFKETTYEDLKGGSNKLPIKKRKDSKAGYIASTHYLTAGFAIPFIIFMIYGSVIYFIIPGILPFPDLIIGLIVSLIATWLGIIYSSGYLYKTYSIDTIKKNSIVKISTIYIITLVGIGRVMLFLKEGLSNTMIIQSIYYIILIILFYYLSKKYIKTNI